MGYDIPDHDMPYLCCPSQHRIFEFIWKTAWSYSKTMTWSQLAGLRLHSHKPILPQERTILPHERTIFPQESTITFCQWLPDGASCHRAVPTTVLGWAVWRLCERQWPMLAKTVCSTHCQPTENSTSVLHDLKQNGQRIPQSEKCDLLNPIY